jgi:hypothetical protein
MFHRLGVLIGHVSDTPSQTKIAVLLAILASGLLEFTFHVGLSRLGVSPLTDAVVDAALCGIFFGLVLWSFLAAIGQRRNRVRQDLERIAELNHEIRNALEVIVDSHFDAEAPHRNIVLESVNRIDVVLKRIFPVGVG